MTINSNWGSKTPTTAGVFNFAGIDFGDYNGTVVPTLIQSAQIKNIATLAETHDFSLAGDTSGFDVIDDFFLTQGSGSKTTHTQEIEVLLHTPSYSAGWVQSLKPIGTFTGSGVTWTVAVQAGKVPDIIFMPSNQADVASGTVDIKAMLDWLVTKGVLTGNEYFNGMGTGLETRQGSGSTTFNSFSVDYKVGTASTALTSTSAAQGLSAAAATPFSATLFRDTGTSSTDQITSDPRLVGQSSSNAVVTIREGAAVIGTTQADANGSWSFTPVGLLDGVHQLAASAQNSTVTTNFTLDSKAPAVTSGLKNDTGSSATDRTTSDPTLTGVGDANAVVTLTEGTVTLGTTTADASGNWTYKPLGLSDGLHQITATETDAAGNAAQVTASFTLDTTAPTFGVGLKNDTGTSSSDKVTSDATLTGWTTPGELLTFAEGSTVLGTTNVDSSGAWTYTPVGLGVGAHQVTASLTDAAGIVGSNTINFALTAPESTALSVKSAASISATTVSSSGATSSVKVPAISLVLKNDAGSSGSDRVTNDATIKGSGAANALVTLKEGTTTLGTTTADSAGNWTFQPTGLADGSHTIVAKETLAGVTLGTGQISLWLDTKAPTFAAALKNDTGTSHSDKVTSDPTLMGWTTAGAVITFKEGSTVLGSTTVDASGAWTYKPTSLAEGAHQITASLSDTAGNIGTTTIGMTYDSKPPSITSALKNDIGASSSDRITSDATLTGHADANQVVSFTEGAAKLGSATADANGLWTFVPKGLAAGAHTIVTSGSDLAGNLASSNLAFTLTSNALS